MSTESMTRNWLAANDALARTLPRGTATPEGRRDVLQREYEVVAARLGHVPMPRAKHRPAVDLGNGGQRVAPVIEGDGGEGYMIPGEEGDGSPERTVYGAGRALERAIQEARGFELVYVGEVSR